MPEPILNTLKASLAPSGVLQRTLQHRIRARLEFINAHIIIAGTFIRFVRGPDQLIRFAPKANIIQLAPDTFEEELPEDRSRLIKMRNQTTLISYDLAQNVREISKSYYDD
jgi:hypothetical protein